MMDVNQCVRRAGWLLVATLFLGACAEQVGDIDRTQPNALRKADFEGEWYIRQTVIEVPPAHIGSQEPAMSIEQAMRRLPMFEGFTLDTERVRWRITEDRLEAHRSYSVVPGMTWDSALDADGRPVDTRQLDTEGIGDDGFMEQVVAAFQIRQHFDVIRSYNPSTGEQTNVLVEDASDRHWYERDFMRVNWAANMVDSFQYAGQRVGAQSVSTMGEEYNNDLSIRFVRDEEGELEYFDFVTDHYLFPSVYDCYLYGPTDCASQRVRIRTSVMRVAAESDYEPVTYTDRDMDRFGYFRTERTTYNRERGATQEGQIQLANRHNLWQDTWQRDAEGNLVRDTDGKPIARPFAERTPRPIVYHLSLGFPQEMLEPMPGLTDTSIAVETVLGWDRAFRRTVAAARNNGDVSDWENNTPHMFVLCHNPVQELPVWPPDPAYSHWCGEEGDRVLMGDLRYNVKYWVHNPQAMGPLGYGPSAADPVTGEIISGTAYMYGASVDTYASYAVDILRFVNGDLTESDLMDAEYLREQIRAGRDGRIDPRGGPKSFVDIGSDLSMDLSHLDVAIPTDVTELMAGGALERVNFLRERLANDDHSVLPRYTERHRQAHQRLMDSGFDTMLMDDEWLNGFGMDHRELADNAFEALRPGRVLQDLETRHRHRNSRLRTGHCMIHVEDMDDSLYGIAQHYEGRRDYDQIWQEIRGLIYKSVQEHEIGHTIGLRHNFSGSADVLNYFDGYWTARRTGMVGATGETIPFRRPNNVAEIYGVAALTDEQIDMRMREYQYSSIMDYSSGFHTDIQGIGRYDEAAILYAYSKGADAHQTRPSSSRFNTQQSGFVEVWDDVPEEAWNTLGALEERRSIGYYNHLELFHYTTLVEALGGGDIQAGVDRIADRRLMRLSELERLRERGEERPLEVPYLFCSDEYRSSRQQCRTWDRGADPLEQTLDYIQRYRSFYFLENFRRDRIAWNPSSVLNRYAGRYFFELVDTYQRWLLAVAINSNRPDPILDNGWTFAAYAGLNLLGEVLTTPSNGSYVRRSVEQFDPETGEPIDPVTRYVLSSFDRTTNAEIYVPLGEGRRRFSMYDADEGYYYYLYPVMAGHQWAYIGAVLAIVSNAVQVRGVEVGSLDTTYSIPPYLVFQDELTELFNGLFLNDVATVGPVYEFGSNPGIRPRTLVSLSAGNDLINPENGLPIQPSMMIAQPLSENQLPGTVVDPRIGFTERVYPALYGMAFFTSNYSLNFPDQNKVFRLGSGESIDPGPGFEVISFCDPTPLGGGQCYAALNPEGQPPRAGAARLIQRARISAMQYERNPTRNLEFEIQDRVQDLNMMRSLYQEFGRNF